MNKNLKVLVALSIYYYFLLIPSYQSMYVVTSEIRTSRPKTKYSTTARQCCVFFIPVINDPNKLAIKISF